MALISKHSRGAVLALGVTILLLTITAWNLYHEYPDIIVTESNSRINISVPSNLPSLKVLRAAAILETRSLENLVPLILHFSVILGQNWPIHVFTSSSNRETFQKSSAFVRLVNSEAIVLRDLPKGVPDDFAFHELYKLSSFLTQKWFWEEMAPAEYVFLFNAESVLCSRAEKSLDDFLGYDLVIPEREASEDLGGLISLRKRETMLGILENSAWKPGRLGNADSGGNANADSEAMWFLRRLEEDPVSDENIELPTKEVTGSFVMDDAWQDQPFGYVHVQSQHDRLEEIIKWCPEYMLAIHEE